MSKELDEIRWQFEVEKFPTRSNPYTFQRLLEVAHKNPVVNCMLTAWRKGNFPSFESSLIAMILELAAQNEKLLESAVIEMANRPTIILTGEPPIKS